MIYVIRCKADSANNIWILAINLLEEWLLNNYTESSLQKYILLELNKWRSNDIQIFANDSTQLWYINK